MKILAVDDDPIILDLLAAIFGQGGFSDVELVPSGAAALQMIEQEEVPFDCLIVDLNMPGMDGIALTQRVRMNPRYLTTPIIVLTARHDNIAVESAFGAGANDYITKPFEVSDIVTRVQIATRMIESEDTVYMVDPTKKVPGAVAGEHPFELSDPLQIMTVRQHTRQFSLGNYLSQLSRKKIDDCFVFAVRVDPIEQLYETCTTQELAVALSEVTEAINETLNPNRLLSAYFGSGVFVCISTTKAEVPWAEVETLLQNNLNASGAVYDTGQPMDISVAVGGPVRPNASKTQRVRRTFDRAMGKLRKRPDMSGHKSGRSDIS